MTDRTGLRARQPLTPQRMCLGCRGRDSRSVLQRMVATVEDDGDVVLTPDPARCRSGRGAWLHPSTDCLEQAVRRRAFTRALRLASGPDVRPVREHLDQLVGNLAAPPPDDHQTAGAIDHLSTTTSMNDQPKAGQTLMSTR